MHGMLVAYIARCGRKLCECCKNNCKEVVFSESELPCQCLHRQASYTVWYYLLRESHQRKERKSERQHLVE